MPDRKKLQLLPYYANHDTRYILLQKDPIDTGEVCWQCFMPGNKLLSFPGNHCVVWPDYDARVLEPIQQGLPTG